MSHGSIADCEQFIPPTDIPTFYRRVTPSQPQKLVTFAGGDGKGVERRGNI